VRAEQAVSLSAAMSMARLWRDQGKPLNACLAACRCVAPDSFFPQCRHRTAEPERWPFVRVFMWAFPV